MLIGISGKIGSGKDTVGKIIQYLIAKQYALDKDIEETEIQPFHFWKLPIYMKILNMKNLLQKHLSL